MSACGHGRGKGRGFSLEQLGIEKGEALPDRAQAPPQTFPPLEFAPIKLQANSSDSYLRVLKKEFQEYMQASQYYIELDAKKPDIERYYDKYNSLSNCRKPLEVSWRSVPKELHPKDTVSASASTSKKRTLSQIKPNITATIKRQKTQEVNINEKLDKLERKELTQSDKKENVNEDEEEREYEEEVEDVDEELDEGTDYVASYFDNGESYLDDEDDALEEEVVF